MGVQRTQKLISGSSFFSISYHLDCERVLMAMAATQVIKTSWHTHAGHVSTVRHLRTHWWASLSAQHQHLLAATIQAAGGRNVSVPTCEVQQDSHEETFHCANIHVPSRHHGRHLHKDTADDARQTTQGMKTCKSTNQNSANIVVRRAHGGPNLSAIFADRAPAWHFEPSL